MRSLVRKIASAIWILSTFIVVTIFAQNIESISSRFGTDKVFYNWWAISSKYGYHDWILLGFSFISGVTATLWVDFLFRKKDFIKWGQNFSKLLGGKLLIENDFSIGWSRSGNNPMEIVSIEIAVRNWLNKT